MLITSGTLIKLGEITCKSRLRVFGLANRRSDSRRREINRSINSFGQQTKMKVVIVTLLLISAAEAVRNLVGLPDEVSSRLHQLLKGTCRYIVMLIEINMAI